MGKEEKRKREERTVSAGDMALKSPRLHGQHGQAAAASPSDSSESSEEATSSNSSSDSAGDSRRCPHMILDSESVDIGVCDIKNSMELPTCHYPGCGITWKGDGEDKEGMMKCIECYYISCAGPMRADRDDPLKHALLHSAGSNHFIAQWYDLPNLGYCFRCERVMKMSDNQNQWSEDVLAEVDRKVKDERGLVASNAKDDTGMVDRNLEFDLPMVASSSNVDWASVTRNALLRIGAGSHASEYAAGNGYIIRRMPNHGGTCFMNASLQCLLALGKLRTMILRSDAQLGELGLHLKQLFVETSIVNNARHMLDPKMIVEYMWSRYQERFKFKEMGDSQEFLTSLRNALDNEVLELNTMRIMQGGSDVFPTIGQSIFRGQLTHTVSCKSCSHNSVKSISFNELILPLTPKDPPPPARSVAEFGNSQIPGLGLGDGATEEAPKLLQVDSTEVKDVVQSRLETQKNDAPRDIIEVPIALVPIPNLFDDAEGMEESGADSHNPEDKEKAQSSDIVYVEAGHMNLLLSLQDCLTQTLFSHQLKNCENCSKVAEVPETNGSKNVEQIMASTNVNSIDGDKAELSDRKTCTTKQASDLSNFSVGKSCDEKDLASCSTADEKAESHEGAAPSFLPTDGNDGANETQLISKLPPVLTIQLMRYTRNLSKLREHVRFEEILDLGPFMDASSEDKDNPSYHLVGVIMHAGDTVNKGHYISYVRGSGASWVCANDHDITVVSLEQVLGCETYILFYERMENRGMPGILPTN